MGTIFIAGVYGVGKSTLCAALSHSLEIPTYSAGDLISRINGDDYKRSKAVKDVVYNQEILALEVKRKLEQHPVILLAGHFCIFSEHGQVETLPLEVFEKLYIKHIFLLDANTSRIIENLASRDHKYYDYRQMRCLQKEEHAAARRIADHIGCPLDIHYMSFNANDTMRCLSILREASIRERYGHSAEGQK